MYTLDPTTNAIPWSSRAYCRKRKPLSGSCEEEGTKRLQLRMESNVSSDEASSRNLKDSACGKCVMCVCVRVRVCACIYTVRIT